MKCPVCKDQNLVMAERQGIEIDYCPSCRGIWLDRGELDKIIERSSSDTRAQPQNSNNEERDYKNRDSKYDEDKNYKDDRYYKEKDSKYAHYGHQGQPRKKKEGFLSEIFDFDF